MTITSKELREKYPDFFSDCVIGVSFPVGWSDLIDNTIKAIIAVDEDARVMQIKEKFGTLRFYIVGSSRATKIVMDAEAKSKKICCICGNDKGSICNRNSYLVTICPKCELRELNEDL
jgi:hypothetical protein